jgi:hypothetical protein
MVSAALGRGFRAIRAAGGQRGLVRDRVGERLDDDTGRGFAASAADPSDDRRDGLDVQAGQPACHLPVPFPELDPGGAQRLGQQAEPGLRGQEGPVRRPQREQRLRRGLERTQHPAVPAHGSPLDGVVNDRGGRERGRRAGDRGELRRADQAVRLRPCEPGHVVAADRLHGGAPGDRGGHRDGGEHALITRERTAERPAGAAAGGLADLVERACRWRAGSRREVGVQGSSPVMSGMGPWPCQAESAPGAADLDDGELLRTRACRLAGRTHRARTRHARTPGENPARPGRLLRFPVPMACGSALSRL